MKKGTLYGIGVGPGDPDLITLKAQKCLQSCPVIAYPAPVGKNSLALQIARTHIPQKTDLLRFDIPMVSDTKILENTYNNVANQLQSRLNSGVDIGYICEGDPLFYGSFVYLMERLKNKFSIKIIPGVSSIMAGASVFQHPLSMHNTDLHILPGTLSREVLQEKLRHSDTVVIMKVGQNFSKIVDILKSLHRYDQSYFVAHATMDQEFHCPLPMVKTTQIPYFSLIYVRGKNV